MCSFKGYYNGSGFSVFVPKQYLRWPQSTEIGITVRPSYILLGYKDPEGLETLKRRVSQRAPGSP